VWSKDPQGTKTPLVDFLDAVQDMGRLAGPPEMRREAPCGIAQFGEVVPLVDADERRSLGHLMGSAEAPRQR
jgi:hypothetical protein